MAIRTLSTGQSQQEHGGDRSKGVVMALVAKRCRLHALTSLSRPRSTVDTIIKTFQITPRVTYIKKTGPQNSAKKLRVRVRKLRQLANRSVPVVSHG